MWLWSFSLSKTTFALPAATSSSLLSQQVLKLKGKLPSLPRSRTPVDFGNRNFSDCRDHLPAWDGAPISRFSTVQWKRIPCVQTTEGFLIREDISAFLFSAQIAIWRRTQSSCELVPYLASASVSESTLAFSETDTHHSSLLGEMLGRFFLWCCDKRLPQTSHSLFRSAESVPSERKSRILSEYILMHLQPPIRAHKSDQTRDTQAYLQESY